MDDFTEKHEEKSTKIDSWEEQKPSGAYGIVYSKEVTLEFEKPIYLDSVYV
jgi:hypothetical protein